MKKTWTATLDGGNINIDIYTYGDSLSVSSMTHWELAPDLVKAGFLTKRFYQQCWGHTEVFINPAMFGGSKL